MRDVSRLGYGKCDVEGGLMVRWFEELWGGEIGREGWVWEEKW